MGEQSMKPFQHYLAVFLTFSLLTVPLTAAIRPTSTPSHPVSLFDNHPPNTPTFSGPHNAAPYFDIAFTADATDPDGDQVYFKIDWGDGNMTDWLGPVNSTEHIVTHYGWYYTGNFTILIKVKDSQGLECNQSLVFNITIEQQIAVVNLQPGFVYLGQSYFFVGVFYLIGAIAIMTTSPSLPVNISASPSTASIVVTATTVTSGISVNITDDNATDGFNLSVPLKSGLYQLLILAYDAEGNLIDGYLYNFVLYWQVGTMNAARALHTHL